MGLACLPTLVPDIKDVYDAYFEAFKGEPIIDILFPSGVDESFRKLHTESTAEYWKQSKCQYTVKCIDSETGEVIGMGLWDLYMQERTDEEIKDPGVTWLEGTHKERAERILGPLWKKKIEIMGRRPHIYCHVIAVKQEHQRRGAGRMLTQWGLDLAEQLRLPIYLESSPQAERLYRKLGFFEVDNVVHEASDLGKEEDVGIPLMVKMPSTLSMSFPEWRSKFST
ncbi:Ribosomal protein S18 acetylase RimI [Geosmithia morbida]|uniref:Ribosomal protein S18 acetylase RimI n=1 Tax=Geosmithia morbida TaxID=1094350 RepID=A0A9P4Z1I8_9HYPO|nr:Ribosomal protein S18 acetylase RimI [Geosmithia morbida]KAF4125980.1 Ribosomal protein S18 acetylase RimI [Geosmithia morbida]